MTGAMVKTMAKIRYSLFKVPINETAIKLKKQIVNDPYDMIENADEIREYIKKLLNITQEPQI